MSGIRCKECGRDLDEIGQDNMSRTSEPLCVDCWNDSQSYAVGALRREVRGLKFENSRLREKLDAMAEETDAPKVGQLRNVAAAMPCLKDDEARGFKLPDVSVEVDADAVAEKAAKSLRNAMGQVMRMAVE